MNTLSSPPPVYLVASDDVAHLATHSDVVTLSLSEWTGRLIDLGDRLVLSDMTVLGLCLTQTGRGALDADPRLVALIKALDLPIVDILQDPNPETLLSATVNLLIQRDNAGRTQMAEDRAALAELRKLHMQMQTDHAELERWVWDALAPKFKRLRAWPATARSIPLSGLVVQPLPVPSRGLMAYDVHIHEAAPSEGRIGFRMARPVGDPFEGATNSVSVQAGDSGWVRLVLPQATPGQPEDAELHLWWEGEGTAPALSLAPETPFPDLAVAQDGVTASAPLALHVFKSLPRQPAPPLYDHRRGLPADGITRFAAPSELGKPVRLPWSNNPVRRAFRKYPDFARVEYWEKENVVFVHPSIHRPVVACVPGLKVERLAEVTGIIQIGKLSTLPIAFALGVVPHGSVTAAEDAIAHLGDWMQLLPGEWGDVWKRLETPLSGDVDLLLATGMPNVPFNRDADALFHGFRLTTDSTGPAEQT